MSWFTGTGARLRLLFGRRAVESRMDHEFRFHLDMEAERLMREEGLAPAEARRRALVAFGGVEKHSEALRAGRGLAWLGGLSLDFRLGARMLFKYPGLTIIGGMTLAAAMALGAGFFEFAWEMASPRLPLDEGDRIVRLEILDADSSKIEHQAVHDFLIWRDQLKTVDQLGAYRAIERNLITPDGRSEAVEVAEISPVGFTVTRVPPLLGRPLVESDAEPGAESVVVIGYDLWHARFNADPAIVGRTVQISRVPATIVGVMPEKYAFPINHQVWTPLRLAEALPRTGPSIQMFGRLRDDVSLETAQAELASMGGRMASAYPATHRHLRPRVLAYAAPQQMLGTWIASTLFAWLLLLIAGTNVATLMFARTALRESEIVVRTALGASRLRVMAQLFVESLVLSLVAAAAALVLVTEFFSYARANFVSDVEWPFWWDLSISPPTVIYTFLIAVGVAAIVGLLPAFRATGPHVQTALRGIGGGGTQMRIGRVWSGLIIFQVALSVVGLPVAIAMTSNQLEEQRMRAAFNAEPYFTFRPDLDYDEAGDAGADLPARMTTLVGELERRLEADPEVVGVTFADALPGVNHPIAKFEVQRGTEPPVMVDSNIENGYVETSAVDPGLFELFDVPVTAGRSFRSGDVGSAHAVAIINEALAHNLGGNPIGVRLRTMASGQDEKPGPWLEVVGVVPDFGLDPTANGQSDIIYTPASVATLSWLPHVAIRVAGDAQAFEQKLRDAARQVAPDLRLYEVMTLERAIWLAGFDGILMTATILIPVTLLLLLSAAALFALMSVAVARRTREIGIRLAIGASPRALLGALFRRAALQIGAGIVAGNLLVLVLMRVIVDEFNAPMTAMPMLAASLIMMIVGSAACFLPARRALAVQPTEALSSAQ